MDLTPVPTGRDRSQGPDPGNLIRAYDVLDLDTRIPGLHRYGVYRRLLASLFRAGDNCS